MKEQYIMDRILSEITEIKESQLRTEIDLDYHIKRTDKLETKIDPLVKFHSFLTVGMKIVGGLGIITALAVGIDKLI